MNGLDLVIPQRYENILEFLYGKDWIIQKNYDWVNDINSTIVEKNNLLNVNAENIEK